jgi:nitronate monooxygenase
MAEGNTDGGIWSAGMVQGLIDDIPTVKELIDGIIAEANEIINARLASMTK